MGQALYRKYRSKSLDEIIGQEHITKTLANALKAGKISHAYLLTGPRGVGKTSIARILAHEVNGLPYDDESNHMDIIEIDAASNRRIDEIRDLRDKVHISPTSSKYKVYIIDEVHMLTKEAFNALLKTLEEPPEHVIFILATTEAHKLPETIISRTQRFSLKPIDKEKVVKHIGEIAKAEGLKGEPEAFELIAAHGDGSFRDSISLLDQASNDGKTITLSNVQRILGIAPSEAIDQLLQLLVDGSVQDLLQLLANLFQQGYQGSAIARQLAKELRIQLMHPTLPLDVHSVSSLLKQLIDVPASANPEQFLEIILLDIVLKRPGALTQPEVQTTPAKKESKPVKSAEQPKIEPKKSKKSDTETIVSTNSFSIDQWPEILETLKRQYATLYGVLRMAQPSVDGDTLLLEFRFPFHQKRMSEAKTRQLITDIIQKRTNNVIKIESRVRADIPLQAASKSDAPEKSLKTEGQLDTISNIFGSAEMLES